jgi:predicted  nucleic acid-binding Zn-ribbon protein
LVTTNIDTRITRFENNFEGHKKFYEKMKEIVSNFISKAKEKGKDTAALEEDLATLQGKLDNFSSHKAAHIEDLKATQEYACGESDGAFKAALEKARDSFKVLREDVSDIRNFYQTKIRADIKALRAEKETSNE